MIIEKITVFYSPHRIQCTAGVSNSPLTMRCQFMPLYGPQEWFDFELQTAVPVVERTAKL